MLYLDDNFWFVGEIVVEIWWLKIEILCIKIVIINIVVKVELLYIMIYNIKREDIEGCRIL